MSFGGKLKALRVAAYKSQDQVAKELKARYPHLRMTQASYSPLERRERAPKGELLEAISSYFGVPPEYFYTDSVESPQRVYMGEVAYSAAAFFIRLDENEHQMIEAWRRADYPTLLIMIAEAMELGDEQ